MTSLLPSPQAILWALAAIVAIWGVSVAWRSWRVKGRWQLALLGLLLQPVALLILGLSARVPGDAQKLDFLTLAGWSTLYYGLLVALVGLRRDPSRGRPRCPKCWYDMSGAAADTPTCPECGRVMRSRRDLHRSRPSRILVVFGLAAVLASYPVFVWNRMRTSPLIGLVPTVALVAALPWLPDSLLNGKHKAPDFAASLKGRFISGRGTWERELIRLRARGVIKRAGEDLRRMAPALEFLDEKLDSDLAFVLHRAYARSLAGTDQERRMALDRTSDVLTRHEDVIRGRIDDLVPGLIAGLDDPAPGAAEACAWQLSLAGAAAEPAAPRLIQLMKDCAPNHRKLFGSCLRDLAASSPAIRQSVLEAVRDSTDTTVRAAGAVVLSAPGIPDAQVRDFLLGCLRDSDRRTSLTGGRALVSNGTDPEGAADAIMKEYRSYPDDQYLFMLANLGEPARKYWPEVTEALKHVVPDNRIAAVEVLSAWARAGWDPGPAAARVRELLRSRDPDVARAAQRALSGMRLPIEEPP